MLIFIFSKIPKDKLFFFFDTPETYGSSQARDWIWARDTTWAARDKPPILNLLQHSRNSHFVFCFSFHNSNKIILGISWQPSGSGFGVVTAVVWVWSLGWEHLHASGVAKTVLAFISNICGGLASDWNFDDFVGRGGLHAHIFPGMEAENSYLFLNLTWW